ncbi:MAG: hypothetical protein OHK0039_25900 [Bacteroidia bacterium]
MRKSDMVVMPQFFDRYIALVEDMELSEALRHHAALVPAAQAADYARLADRTYAPGKWTLKEVLQHVIDNERVQAYRALRFARNDQTALPGYDENHFAQHTGAQARSLDSLVAEFAAVRAATIALFDSFDAEMLQREGTASGIRITPLGLGFMLVGHQLHHAEVVTARYLSLV